MKLKTEVVVIGAGSGGYVAAIRLAQLGKKVLLVERQGKEGLGGICMNHGCIPSKALSVSSKFFRDVKTAGEVGINVSSLSLDIAKLQDWKDGIVVKLRGGIEMLLKKHGVGLVHGTAHFESSSTISITGNDDVDSIDFDYAIVATGAYPNSLPGVEFDGTSVISYEEALDFRELPKDLLVIGGGYISVELATCYAKFGSHVRVVHRRDHILREYDEDAVNVVQRRMIEDGIEFILKSTVSKVEKLSDGRVRVYINSEEKGQLTVDVDKVLVAVGVSPNSKTLGLENTRTRIDQNGFITVDNKMSTTDPKIFAIGDVAREPMLAHKATREGKIAAEVIAGMDVRYDNKIVPIVIFSDPELAVAGMTEKDAKERGIETNVGKFPFSALGRAWIERETKGFVKVIEEKSTGKLLGITIVGPDACNMIAEAVLAIEKGMKTEDVMNTIHGHPTLPESVMEAAEDVRNVAIHILKVL